jgi:hypothetical protein
VLALLLTAAVVMAAAPQGPRLAVVKLTTEPSRLDLVTVNRGGGDPLRLAGRGASSTTASPRLTRPTAFRSPWFVAPCLARDARLGGSTASGLRQPYSRNRLIEGGIDIEGPLQQAVL